MYVGRIVIVGRAQGRSFAAYRVSSRSFPNRRAGVRNNSILVSPVDPADLSKNPYIAYNCIRVAGDVAVVANGTHSDMILDRIESGERPIDALAVSLVAFGHERDELDTPRIAGVVRGDRGWLGIAGKEEFRAREFRLEEGGALMVATYERTGFEAVEIGAMGSGAVKTGSVEIDAAGIGAVGAVDAEAIARQAFDLAFERPVCAASALYGSDEPGRGYDLAVYNPM